MAFTGQVRRVEGRHRGHNRQQRVRHQLSKRRSGRPGHQAAVAALTTGIGGTIVSSTMRPILSTYPVEVNDGWRPTTLSGVMRRTVPLHEDGRGSFAELWRASWTQSHSGRPFVQSNISRSDTGVLRGLHFHLRQTDLWVMLDGRAHVTLVDIRAPLEGGHGSAIASSEVIGPGEALLIPEGVAHGFWALEPLTLIYLVTNEYDGTDELGFAWDDPEVGAEWPAGRPILSPRDAEAPSLKDALSAAQRTPASFSE